MRFPKSTYNLVSAVGAILALVATLTFVVLFTVIIVTAETNPYTGIVLYMVTPFFLFSGLGMIPIGMWRYHRRLKRGEAEEVVERFAFERVDFVSEPAYPAAGVVRLDSHLRAGGLRRLDSRSRMDGAQGPRGVDPKPEGKKEKKGLERKIAQLEHELETTRAENEGLKAERLKGLLERVVEARSRAGLSRNPGAEAERLRGLGEEALTFIAEDAERANAKAGYVHTGPKATYVAGRGGFREAVEETRMRLFGHRRDP